MKMFIQSVLSASVFIFSTALAMNVFVEVPAFAATVSYMSDGFSPISQLITEENKANSTYLVGRIIRLPVKDIPGLGAIAGLSILRLYYLYRYYSSC